MNWKKGIADPFGVVFAMCLLIITLLVLWAIL